MNRKLLQRSLYTASLCVTSGLYSPETTIHCEKSTNTERKFFDQCLQRHVFHPKLPYPAWDFNWDGKMKEMMSQSTLADPKNFKESRSKGVTRHIILIRHGQYEMEPKDDKDRVLTPLGRRQAELTGQRLALMMRGGLGGDADSNAKCSIKLLHVSDMARAKETADIIASHIPSVSRVKPDPMLNEALPNVVLPPRPDIRGLVEEVDANHERIENAFHKYIHRSIDEHKTEARHEFEVIVCHGNIIRYFFCRALQLPPEAWLRMATFNCSITYLMVQPNGYVSARMVGDVGHLGYEDLSFSEMHGLNW